MVLERMFVFQMDSRESYQHIGTASAFYPPAPGGERTNRKGARDPPGFCGGLTSDLLCGLQRPQCVYTTQSSSATPDGTSNSSRCLCLSPLDDLSVELR